MPALCACWAVCIVLEIDAMDFWTRLGFLIFCVMASGFAAGAGVMLWNRDNYGAALMVFVFAIAHLAQVIYLFRRKD